MLGLSRHHPAQRCTCRAWGMLRGAELSSARPLGARGAPRSTASPRRTSLAGHELERFLARVVLDPVFLAPALRVPALRVSATWCVAIRIGYAFVEDPRWSDDASHTRCSTPFARFELSFTGLGGHGRSREPGFPAVGRGYQRSLATRMTPALPPRRWASSVWGTHLPEGRHDARRRSFGGISPRGTASPRCEDEHASTGAPLESWTNNGQRQDRPGGHHRLHGQTP